MPSSLKSSEPKRLSLMRQPRKPVEKNAAESFADNFSMSLGKLKALQAENELREMRLNELKSQWDEETVDTLSSREKELFSCNKTIEKNRLESAEFVAKTGWLKSEVQKLETDIQFCEEGLDLKQRHVQQLSQQNQEVQSILDSVNEEFEERKNELEAVKKHHREQVEQLASSHNELRQHQQERLKSEAEVQLLYDSLMFCRSKNLCVVDAYADVCRGQLIDFSQFYRGELTKAINDVRYDFKGLERVQRVEMEMDYQARNKELAEQAKYRNSLNSLEDSESCDFVSLVAEVKMNAVAKNDLERGFERLRIDELRIEREMDELASLRQASEVERDEECIRLMQDIQNLRSSLEQAREEVANLKYEKNMYEALAKVNNVRNQDAGDDLDVLGSEDEESHFIVVELSKENKSKYFMKNVTAEDHNVRDWKLLAANEDDMITVCSFADKVLKPGEVFEINLKEKGEGLEDLSDLDVLSKLDEVSVIICNADGIILSNALDAK